MSVVIVNGTSYECIGRNISINNGKIKVDGKEIIPSTGRFQREITVEVYGDVESIDSDGSVRVNGNVGEVNCGGSANIGKDVCGDVSAGGSVSVIGNIKGNVSCGGSIIAR